MVPLCWDELLKLTSGKLCGRTLLAKTKNVCFDHGTGTIIYSIHCGLDSVCVCVCVGRERGGQFL